MDRYSILVADDDAMVRETIREALQRGGYDAVTASCGTEAIDIVRRRNVPVHASILDMFMPDLTGIETLELFIQAVDRLPTILVTADESRELLTKAMEAGAYTLLRKPVSARLIVVTVTHLLDRYYGGSTPPRRG